MKKVPQQSDRTAVAVLISDIHYSLSTLALADAALRAAIDKAAELKVPLIVAGDLHDTKANLRGECVKTLLDTFEYAADKDVGSWVLVGNHDLLSEKGKGHSLEFLRSHTFLVAELTHSLEPDLYFIPYQSDPAEFERILTSIPKGSTVIMHQGVTGAESGEYVYDKSAINKELLADYRVISGHYHKAQDIKCGRPQKGAVGLMSFIGSPYTVTFAEANDGPKGFQILYSDGLLEQVPLDLRRHIVVEFVVGEDGKRMSMAAIPAGICADDLLWAKIKGPALALDKIKKSQVADWLNINHTSFKLDKIPTDTPVLAAEETEKKNPGELLDLLIDKSGESPEKKVELKALWRTLV